MYAWAVWMIATCADGADKVAAELCPASVGTRASRRQCKVSTENGQFDMSCSAALVHCECNWAEKLAATSQDLTSEVWCGVLLDNAFWLAAN